MTDTDNDKDRSDEPIQDFDETNGLVEGLDGDDDGALPGDEIHEPFLGNLFIKTDEGATTTLGDESDDSGETPYSEEGRP